MTIPFVLSVRMEQLGFYWKNFYEIWYLCVFKNLFRKLKSYYNVTKITDNLCYTLRTFRIIHRRILLKIRNVLDKVCRENQNTRFIFSNCFPKIVPLRDNLEKYGRPRVSTCGNIIWRTHVACWIPKATSTRSEVIIIAFLWQQCSRESASILCLFVNFFSFM